VEFGRDEAKRLVVFEKHQLGFRVVIAIFHGPHILLPARSEDTERFLAIGLAKGIRVSVIFTLRRKNSG
jgi:uncharacterized DUF497 family protein